MPKTRKLVTKGNMPVKPGKPGSKPGKLPVKPGRPGSKPVKIPNSYLRAY